MTNQTDLLKQALDNTIRHADKTEKLAARANQLSAKKAKGKCRAAVNATNKMMVAVNHAVNLLKELPRAQQTSALRTLVANGLQTAAMGFHIAWSSSAVTITPRMRIHPPRFAIICADRAAPNNRAFYTGAAPRQLQYGVTSLPVTTSQKNMWTTTNAADALDIALARHFNYKEITVFFYCEDPDTKKTLTAFSASVGVHPQDL